MNDVTALLQRLDALEDKVKRLGRERVRGEAVEHGSDMSATGERDVDVPL